MAAPDRTLTLFDDLTRALREARFDRLPVLMAEIESQLPRSKASRTLIRRRIEENRRLLAAASEGMVAGRRRIAEVTASLSTLNVYDATGRRNSVMPGRDGFERKA